MHDAFKVNPVKTPFITIYKKAYFQSNSAAFADLTEQFYVTIHCITVHNKLMLSHANASYVKKHEQREQFMCRLLVDRPLSSERKDLNNDWMDWHEILWRH